MNIIKKHIFWSSRKVNPFFRNILGLFFLIYVKIRNFIKYNNKDIFHHLNIEISRNCNRRCNYCPVSKYPKFNNDKEISFKEFSKIIDQLKEVNFSGEIHFTGFYEPLLVKDLLKYIEYAKKTLKSAKLTVYTNGDNLNKNLLEDFSNLSVFLIISLHGDDKVILEMTKNHKNVIIKENIEDYLLSSRGGLVSVKKQEKKRYCVLPSVEMTIDSGGNVILCSDDFFSKNIFGNIKNENLLDIWNKKEFKRERNNILMGKSTRNICKHCFL